MDKFEKTENSENISKLQLQKEFTQLFAFLATAFTLLPTNSEQKNKVRKISEISEFSYLAYGQIRKLEKLGKFFKASITTRTRSVLVVCPLSNCFHASGQKNKIRKISEISEFSYLAYGQIRKHGKLGIFFKDSVMKELQALLVACLIASVFMLLATDSKQKSKVRNISEISECSYLACRQIGKFPKICMERSFHVATSLRGRHFHALRHLRFSNFRSWHRTDFICWKMQKNVLDGITFSNLPQWQ